MAEPHEGWDSELFVQPPDEKDLCGICCEVLQDAVETNCGHAFCEKCIRNWLVKRNVCPQDQSPLTWEDCRPMVRDRRRILDLKVKCPWCSKQMELRSLREHKKKCEERPDDYEPTPTPEPHSPLDQSGSQHGDKKEEKENYGIEMFEEVGRPQSPSRDRVPSQDQKKAAEEKEKQRKQEEEDKDRMFALQMQLAEQDRARANQQIRRNLSQHQHPQQPQQIRSPSIEVRPIQPRPVDSPPLQQVRLVQPQQIGEAHIEEIDEQPNERIEYYQADGDPNDRIEGQPDQAEGLRPAVLREGKRLGCCGCSDKFWCCLCCVFWVIVLVCGVSLWFFWSNVKESTGL